MVEKNLEKRWEEGTPHHPKSIEIMEALEHIDYKYNNAYFFWKTGGDGDNGEELMYELDVYFECLEAGESL
jgi:hypothetical protein